MQEAHHLAGRAHFGVFEVDLRAGELCKNGLRIRLQEQPFQVLAMLLERPRELVTRDELRKGLWPADTFVDFDHGLNKAINKIREALGDAAENPRFVETVIHCRMPKDWPIMPVVHRTVTSALRAIRI